MLTTYILTTNYREGHHTYSVPRVFIFTPRNTEVPKRKTKQEEKEVDALTSEASRHRSAKGEDERGARSPKDGCGVKRTHRHSAFCLLHTLDGLKNATYSES
jgi:hypothetical protein